jgi:hypothetical protein
VDAIIAAIKWTKYSKFKELVERFSQGVIPPLSSCKSLAVKRVIVGSRNAKRSTVSASMPDSPVTSTADAKTV